MCKLQVSEIFICGRSVTYAGFIVLCAMVE
jgi:hypothetical protein